MTALNNNMTLGSLFDGSGGFPLAGVINGITPAWSSEIEKYPLAVTAARLPNVVQLGDITKIDGTKIQPVDIITFGSPCQDLSVAGKQAGIHNGERSNLFFEAVRIIKEMRVVTNGKYPRFAVWENVPGAFSSNKGEDFKAVLEALSGVMQDGLHIPQPKKWNHAGAVVGDGWSIAWRVYDAQYWGVPQRRKRIYLIADFASERAGEILFESESVCRNTETSGETGQAASCNAERSIGRSDRVKCLNPWDCQSKRQHDIDGAYSTLQAYDGGGGRLDGVVYPINTMVATRGGKDDMRTCFGIGEPGDPQFTISAAHEHGVCYALDRASFNQGVNAKYDFQINDKLVQTVVSNGPGAVCYSLDAVSSNSMKSKNPHSGFHEEQITRTLDTRPDPTCNQGGNVIVEPVYAIDPYNGSVDDMEPSLGSNCGISTGRNGMICLNDQGGSVMDVSYDRTNTLLAPTAAKHPPVVLEKGHSETETALCVGNGQLNQISMREQSNTLDCMHDQQAVVIPVNKKRKYIVRRLTPLECCRLQGFPDWWEDGVGGADTARYKMWGNGIALPCAVDVLRRISKAA